MTVDTQKIKDRIRKLLNLAQDDGAFDGEIDNALRFARRLMLEHNVSESDLKEAKPQDPHEIAAQTEYGQFNTFTQGFNLSTWESTLTHAICKLVGTVNWFYNTGAVKRTAAGTVAYDNDGKVIYSTSVTFYGPAEDIRDAAGLFDEWSHLIVTMARLKYGGCFRGEGRSYAEGFSYGVEEKVRTLVGEEVKALASAAPATGTALVLRQANAVMLAKKQRGQEWLEKDKGIKVRKVRRNVNVNETGAFREGLADGKSSDISRTRSLKLGR